jgi:nucleoid-associated protein YgaU
LRSYGLRFVLQADWLVPSSRESVDADSCWNQALRDEIPGMLLAALHAFMGLADSSSGDVGSGGGSSSAAVAGSTVQQSPEEREAADVAAAGAVGAQQQQQQQGVSAAVGVAAGASATLPAAAGLPQLSREAWLDCWLRSLPLEGQAQGFFAALPHR